MADEWADVDTYIEEHLVGPDTDLDAALRTNAERGLPGIDVSPAQGKFLHLLAVATGARRILEIGTLGGYSTIWLARALPDDGDLFTIEFLPEHAAVARENLARAGVTDRVDVLEGAALDVLPTLADAEPFDLVFIDADKAHNADYLDWAVRLGRPGTTIVVDNVVREGRVLEAGSDDDTVRGNRRLFTALATDDRVEATALQTVGRKGHDGFVLAVVR